jgi:hypothetical protein
MVDNLPSKHEALGSSKVLKTKKEGRKEDRKEKTNLTFIF